jgi:hypothetical protein
MELDEFGDLQLVLDDQHVGSLHVAPAFRGGGPARRAGLARSGRGDASGRAWGFLAHGVKEV